MLSMPGCGTCAMMSRLLGDRVEHALVTERPDLLALTDIQAAPMYIVMEGDTYLGAFAGAMPVSLWELRVAAYTRR